MEQLSYLKNKVLFAATSWVWALVVVVAPFAPGAVQFVRRGVPDILCSGDNASTEIRVLLAAQGAQLLGPYSRFKWSHPGPTFFYAALPIYELFHEHGPALNVFVFICNLIVAIAVILIARKLWGDTFALATGLLLGLYEAVGASFALSDDWNPMVPVMPLALLVFMSVRVALGAIEALPWYLFLASAIMQTHVGYVPPVLFLLASAGVLGLRSAKVLELWRTSQRRVVRSIIIASLVLIFSWALPVYENLSVHPGNLSTLWAFFTSARESEHSFGEAAHTVATELSVFPLAVAGVVFKPALNAGTDICVALALALAGGLALGAQFAFRRRDQATTVLCGLVLGLIVVGVVSVRAIRGEIQEYLVTWITMIGMVAAAAIVAVVLQPVCAAVTERRLRIALAAAGLPLLAAGLWRAGDKPMFSAPDPNLEKVAAEVLSFLRTSRIERPMLQVATKSTWAQMTGLALALSKQRIAFTVDDQWFFLVGPTFKSASSPRFELAVANKPLSKARRSGAKYELVSSAGDLFVYLVRR